MDTQKMTDRLIDFALNFKYEDIPENVIAYQECILLDSIGVMSAATTLEPACTPFIDFAVENSAEPKSINDLRLIFRIYLLYIFIIYCK